MKQKRLIVLLTILALSVSCLFATASVASAEEAPAAATVQIGDYNDNTYWDPNTWCGLGNAGMKRTALRTTELAVISSWGHRFTYKARDLDLSHLKMTIDVTNLPANAVAFFCFGGYGNYLTENGKMNIEFFKSGAHEGKTHVVIGNLASGHNISFNGWVDANGEAYNNFNDNTFMGFSVDGHVITIELNLVDNNYVLTFNGTQTYTIAASVVLEKLGTWTGHSMTYGGFSGTGSLVTVLSNFEDANMRAYYSSNGAHAAFLTSLEKVEAALEEGVTTENVEEVKALYETAVANYAGLKYGDEYWYAERCNAAVAEYNAQFAQLGNDVIIAQNSATIEAYTTNTALSTEEEVLAAATLQASAKAAFAQIANLENLSDEQATAIEAYDAAIVAADEALVAAAQTIVNSQVQAFTDAVAVVNNLETYLAARDARSAINATVKALLAEEVVATVDNAIAEQNAILSEKTATVPAINTNAVTFDVEEGFEYYSAGSTFTSKEKVLLTNFELTMTLDSFATNTGAWVSFGIMEKPEQFINAEDTSVQDNRGVFTLMTYDAALKKMSVQLFVMDYACQRFYDAQIEGRLEFAYELGEEINVRFTTYEETLAGVTNEYLRISINGVEWEDAVSTKISVKSLAYALAADREGNYYPEAEQYMGYLVIANNGTYTGAIKTVNKTDAMAEVIPANAGAEAYDEVNELLSTLPAASGVNAENLEEVKALVATIKTKYAALSAEDQAFVTGYNKVATVEAKIAALENASSDNDSTSSDPVVEPEDDGCTASATGAIGGLAILGLAFLLKKKRA